MKKKSLFMIALFAVAAFAAMLLPFQPGMDEAQAAKSPETIMRANCASCHGELGEGGYASWIDPSQTSMRIAGRSVSSIKKWVRDGRVPEMPAFPAQEISNAELDALATYINRLPGSFIPNPTFRTTVTITDEDPWYTCDSSAPECITSSQVQVNVGDTVRYINAGKTYHPVTQVEFVVSKGLDGTDSGMLGPTLYGGGLYFRTFDTAGTYTFLCKIHPYMAGSGMRWRELPVVSPSPSIYGESASDW